MPDRAEYGCRMHKNRKETRDKREIPPSRNSMLELFSNATNITWQMVVMWVIGAVLIYLAIKKDMEPTLLLPMGFGAILVK